MYVGPSRSKALRSRRERREISYYRGRGAAPGDILGESTTTQRLRTLVARIAQMTPGAGAPAPTVLLLGETGSGKGHTARLLHASGGRRSGPFIEVNCTALPENLVEAELFGHEKGAFTDAKAAHAGLFETADGGTIFLDEIGHVTAPLQSKFLNVIEEKVVRRIGATAGRRVDVQVIAATSRDLEAAVRLGEFREDLFQRLSVAVIRIPPLREREGDAVVLARTFLADTCRRYGQPLRTLSAAAVSKAVHRSATSCSLSGASACAWWRTAVLRPAKEKCGSARPSMGRGSANRPATPRRAWSDLRRSNGWIACVKISRPSTALRPFHGSYAACAARPKNSTVTSTMACVLFVSARVSSSGCQASMTSTPFITPSRSM